MPPSEDTRRRKPSFREGGLLGSTMNRGNPRRFTKSCPTVEFMSLFVFRSLGRGG
jgi:hypothetical protein